jgi:DNA topoisomerase-2
MSQKIKKNLTDTYQKLTQREHVLKRTETYAGSVKPITADMWVVENPEDLSNVKIVKKAITYTPAFIKIFDEILTNASDHFWRTKKVKNIKIKFDGQKFEIENDGPGIPIAMHPKEKCYIPELIFGHLLTGSNFDDTEQRFGGGRNGLGSKITNILSTKFIVETSDGKQKYKQIFRDNMLEKRVGKPSITPSQREYTKIVFYPDWKLFEMDGMTNETLGLIMKRIVDVSVYCPNVRVTYNGKLIPIKNLKDWMQMHLGEETELFTQKIDDNWEIGVAKAPDVSFEQVSVVNGISTHRGGNHVNKIAGDLSKEIHEILQKRNKKLKFNWGNVKNNLFVFVVGKIVNPTFDTQTKEYLTNNMTKEVLDQNYPVTFVNKIVKSSICQSILDWIEARELQVLKRMNKQLKAVRVPTLIDAKSKDRQKCTLYIFEGLSALSSFRKFRDPQTMAAFPLKGKFLNVSDMTPQKILENKEVQNLVAAVGLHVGQKVDYDQLRFNKIYISTDADVDGDAISGLLINFFYRHWPELFDDKKIFKIYTPLTVAKRGRETKYFYTEEEFVKWSSNGAAKTLNQWNIEYKKGLASLEDPEYKKMIQDPTLIEIHPDKNSLENLDIWFGKSSSDRKIKLLTY